MEEENKPKEEKEGREEKCTHSSFIVVEPMCAHIRALY